MRGGRGSASLGKEKKGGLMKRGREGGEKRTGKCRRKGITSKQLELLYSSELGQGILRRKRRKIRKGRG